MEQPETMYQVSSRLLKLLESKFKVSIVIDKMETPPRVLGWMEEVFGDSKVGSLVTGKFTGEEW